MPNKIDKAQKLACLRPKKETVSAALSQYGRRRKQQEITLVNALVDTKGIAISAPGLLICSVARARGWSLFATDADFDIYAKHLSPKPHAVRR